MDVGRLRLSKQVSLFLALLTCALLTRCAKNPEALSPTPEDEAPYLTGGGSIGGDDLLDSYTGSAWFLGERTVHYCVEIDPSFPLSEPVVRAGVAEAIQTWADYLSDNDINESWTQDSYGVITTKYEPQTKCDETTDLRFLFGVDNLEVARAKKRLNDPLAFAEASGKPASGWQKGTIWLAHPKRIPSFQKAPFEKEHLLLTLLHELGHVNGNGHLPDTVMTASAIDLFNHATYAFGHAKDPQNTFPTKVAIDWREQLYSCIGAQLFSGDPDSPISCKRRLFRAYRNDTTRGIIERWLGHSVSDDYRVSVILDKPKAIFTILDGTEKHQFTMALNKNSSDRRFYNTIEHCNSGGERIFYRTFPVRENGTMCAYLYRVDGRTYTKVRRDDGGSDLVSVDVELGGRLAIHASGPQNWETMNFFSAEAAPFTRDFKTPLKHFDTQLDKVRKAFSYKLPERYDAGAAKILEDALEKPLRDLYFEFMGLHNDARSEGLTVFLLNPTYKEVAAKYLSLRESLKPVNLILNEKDREEWNELERRWHLVEDEFQSP